MSFFSRLGDAAGWAGNALKVMGEATPFYTAPRFVWDITTGFKNDDARYNGFANIMKSASSDFLNSSTQPFVNTLASPPVARVFKEAQTVGRNVVREPLATLALVQDSGRIYDPQEWKKAYKGAQTISVGQAYLNPLVKVLDKDFDIYDPEKRDATFNKNIFGKVGSGALDTTAQVFGDPLLAVGKVAKVVKGSTFLLGKIKNADDAARVIDEIVRAQAGEVNRLTPLMENFAKNDRIYANGHPMMDPKYNSNPALSSYLLGSAKTMVEVGDIWRVGLGDPKALAELAQKRADLAEPLANALSNKLNAAEEFTLFGGMDGTGMLPFAHNSKAVVKEAEDYLDALIKNDSDFQSMMELGAGGGSFGRISGKKLLGAEDFIAKARASKYYGDSAGVKEIDPKIEIFQPTTSHRLVQKFSWAAGERPAGVVDFNDMDSYKEITAVLTRLQKHGGVDENGARGLMDNYISATTPELKSQAALNLESAGFRGLAKKWGFTEKEAQDFYSDYNRARTTAMQSMEKKKFAVDPDGTMYIDPLWESQTANSLPLADFDLLNFALKSNFNALKSLKDGGPFYRARDAVAGQTFRVDYLQDLFKASVLLRVAYPLRNGIDSQTRIAAAFGSMTSLSNLGTGVSNTIRNLPSTGARMVDKINLSNAGTIARVERSRVALIKEIEDLDVKIDKATSKSLLYPEKVSLRTDLNTLKTLRDEKLALHKEYQSKITGYKSQPPKRKIGDKEFKHTTPDGNTYYADEAFGGDLGGMFRSQTSSARTVNSLIDTNSDILKKGLKSKGYGAVSPKDVGYFPSWARALNNDFGNAKVIQLLNGNPTQKAMTADEVLNWVLKTPEGRSLLRRNSLEPDEALNWIKTSEKLFNYYLPASSGLRQKLGTITPSDLRNTFPDPTKMPTIHGELLSTNLRNSDKFSLKGIINTGFHYLAVQPEDALARHPLYNHIFKTDYKKRLDLISGLNPGKIISVTEQRAAKVKAHQAALHGMKTTLFNIERRSNLAAATKFIMPFFSAQENAFKTWARLASEKPELISRAGLLWNAANKAGMVEDEEGNKVPEGKVGPSGGANDTIVIHVPDGIKSLPFIGNGLASLGTVGISKRSMDVFLQGGMDLLYGGGNPMSATDLSSFGPFVSVPLSEISVWQPKFAKSLEWALPYGIANSAIEGFLPSWARKKLAQMDGMKDPQYARNYALIWNTEVQKAKENKLPPPTDAKIKKMADDLYNLSIIASFVSPYATRFSSPYDFHIKQWQNFRKEYGVEASEKFLKAFPEFFTFASSISENKTGVFSSVDAVENIKKNRGLVGELYKVAPNLIGLIVNNPTGYDFSPAAYDWLFRQQVSDSSADTFLKVANPADAKRKTEANKGWIEYRELSKFIDAKLDERGLVSVNSNGAEDLKYIKDTIVFDLAVEKGPDGKPILNKTSGQYQFSAWGEDYRDTDGSKTGKMIKGLTMVLENKEYMKANKNNPTWKSVSAYLELRKDLMTVLAGRNVKGISAVANTDLRYIFETITNKLKSEDIGFSDLYDRFLSQDLVYDKQLTPPSKEGN